MRAIQSLNGIWNYRIGEGDYIKRAVPFSDIPVGKSECRLDFNLTETADNRRTFLVFEGITYSAKIYLNDTFLGEMYPYSEYRFEITDVVNKNGNTLVVELYDIGVVFGPSEGWENYSGIIRNVYIEHTNTTYIEDIIWHDELSENFATARCFAEFSVNGNAENLVMKTVLKDKNGKIVAENQTDSNVAEFVLDNPYLWSPDSPILYTLECSAYDGNVLCDTVTQRVGFKKLETKGRRFYLNGEPFFILGVNRHDMFGDSGHTLTEDEMVKDMRMIKDSGVNYIRLVHYPHNKRIIELADELGLLVSEEPGLWQSDMNNPEICSGALEVLKRVVLRDRNNVSIAFWLSFNECRLTIEFLTASAAVCRKYDKYHMVSGANSMTLEDTKKNYPGCGFDFYTMHPYDSTTQRMMESAEQLYEMPLLLTEWGGYYCHNNPALLTEYIRTIRECWNNPEDKPVIAGAVYWCWADMYEFSRGELACSDGILREGLVDIYRNPTADLDVFKREFAKMKYPEPAPEYMLEHTYSVNESGNYLPINISNPDDSNPWEQMIAESKQPVAPFANPMKSIRKMKNGPKLPCEITEIGKLPVSLTDVPYVISDELEILLNVQTSAIYTVGNTSMPKGYPIGGAYGEDAFEYIVEYTDGTQDVHLMKNGFDVTTATAQHGPSRINPVSVSSPRVLRFSYDFDYEHYVINLKKIDVDEAKVVKCLKIKNCKNGYLPLFYGLTVKI